MLVLQLLVEHWRYTPPTKEQLSVERDKEVDRATSGSHLDLGLRLHALADKLRRRKGSARK